MNKQTQLQTWKNKAKELQTKIIELEEVIIRLRNEDEGSSNQIENINKLHATKVRALMKSIQELKKQNALLTNQQKEHKRSDLIEKLKVDIQQSEIAIDALRALINDDKRSDEQILNYLNRGPPRIRPLSREEMRIEIKKLKAQILRLQNRQKGDKAVNDLQQLIPNSSMMDDNLAMDPLHNEKIVELLEEIENLKLQVKSGEQTIVHYKNTINQLHIEIKEMKMLESQWQVEGARKGALEQETSRLKQQLADGSTSTESLLQQIDQLKLDIEIANRNHQDAIRKSEHIQQQYDQFRVSKNNEISRLNKDIVVYKQTIRELEDRLNNQGKTSDTQLTSYRKMMDDKDIEIKRLQEDVAAKEEEIERLIQELQMAGSLRDTGSKDIEIEVLRRKLKELSEKQPAEPVVAGADPLEIEKHKQRVRELLKQVAELQEQVEFLQGENHSQQKKASAMFLVARAEGTHAAPPGPPPPPQPDNRLIEELQAENEQLRDMIEDYEETIKQLRYELEQQNVNNQRLNQKSLENERELEALQRAINLRLGRRDELLQTNAKLKEEILYNIGDLAQRTQLNIPQGYRNEALLSRSRHIANTFSTVLG